MVTRLVADDTNLARRGNDAVRVAPDKAFTSVVQALEAETLQGATAQRVVHAAKELAKAVGINALRLIATLPPETQQNVRRYFT